MIIRELTGQASVDLLSRSRLGRLACTKGSQPYVVPLFFAYHDNYLYCSSTLGQKIEWMRENPLVAVEVDRHREPAAMGVCHRLRPLRGTRGCA